jgi:exo-beta-1,3-glucanase (GH17 family)
MKQLIYIILLVFSSCKPMITNNLVSREMTAEKLLGNPKYQGICYGGYRTNSRDIEPNVSEVKEDLKILAALDIKIIRTYNLHREEIVNVLKAITELKKENPKFEIYVMLGVWIDCKNAWTEIAPIHDEESERNAIEIKEAVRLTNKYPEIIKIISVGNEAMVKWATSYYVTPSIILKWVNHLQELKKTKQLPKNLWITSSDNYLSWGGGDEQYHTEDLNRLIKAVDYISLHSYPIHDERYFPEIWGIKENETNLSDKMKIDAAMLRARDYAISQYNGVIKYMKSIGVDKPVQIGETGWTTIDNLYYGDKGSKAADEYKAAQYYKLMREWSNKEKITCFYFEAFDENWKDSANPLGSENHFGLINLKNQAKFALWDKVDQGIFNGLTRNGKPIVKTYNGDENALWQDVKVPNTILKN